MKALRNALITFLWLWLVGGSASAQTVFVSNAGSPFGIGSYLGDGTAVNAALVPGAYSYGLAARGNTLYVSSGNAIGTYDLSTGSSLNSSFVTGLSQAMGLALGANNDIFVLNQTTGTVGRYNAATGAAINSAFISSGLSASTDYAIAADTSGNLFVGDQNHIAKFNASTGALLSGSFISTTSATYGIAADNLNHLFVTDRFAGTVAEYDATTGAVINATFISGLGSPAGIALDGLGDLFVANESSSGSIGKYNALTGTAINTALDSGLNYPFALAAIPEPSASAAFAGLLVLAALLWRKQGLGG